MSVIGWVIVLKIVPRQNRLLPWKILIFAIFVWPTLSRAAKGLRIAKNHGFSREKCRFKDRGMGCVWATRPNIKIKCFILNSYAFFRAPDYSTESECILRTLNCAHLCVLAIANRLNCNFYATTRFIPTCSCSMNIPFIKCELNSTWFSIKQRE